ncbi:MAG: hypothetical protein AAGG80_01100, partial [Pseudomonadota bacterium]
MNGAEKKSVQFSGHLSSVNLPKMSLDVKQKLKRKDNESINNDATSEIEKLNQLSQLFLFNYQFYQQMLLRYTNFYRFYLQLYQNLLKLSSVRAIVPETPHPSLINEYPGPKISRKELVYLSHGKISAVFGEIFKRQDQYTK